MTSVPLKWLSLRQPCVGLLLSYEFYSYCSEVVAAVDTKKTRCGGSDKRMFTKSVPTLAFAGYLSLIEPVVASGVAGTRRYPQTRRVYLEYEVIYRKKIQTE